MISGRIKITLFCGKRRGREKQSGSFVCTLKNENIEQREVRHKWAVGKSVCACFCCAVFKCSSLYHLLLHSIPFSDVSISHHREFKHLSLPLSLSPPLSHSMTLLSWMFRTLCKRSQSARYLLERKSVWVCVCIRVCLCVGVDR